MFTRIAATLIVATLLTACVAGTNGQAGGGTSEGELAGRVEDSADLVEVAPAPEAAGQEGAGAAAGRDDAAAPAGDVLEIAQLGTAGDKIIKDGRMAVEVAKGGLDAAFERVVRAAANLGGTVVSSTTESAAGRGPAGSVTVRVPADQYERLLIAIRPIGTVRSRQITSQDVTTEYVDLQARLRQQQAQERFYLKLLDRAEDVQDAIAVQQQLQTIQTEIERLKGRLQFLDDRTAFSSLTVEIFEPGAPPLLAEGPLHPTLASYWEQARRGFVGVVGAILVATLSLAPLLILLAAGFVAWRLARRRPAVASTES